MTRPRILHLHSAFDPGGKEVRSVRLINAFGQDAEHAIVSGDLERRGAARLLDPSVKVRWPKFPALRGKPFPNRLRRLAEAMRGYDLVLTYNWGAMDAVMAHTLFAQAFHLPPLIHHEDGFNEDEANGLKPTRNLYRRIALGRTYALVVPSRTLERIALDVWQQPPGKLRRIANGIRTPDYGGKADPGLLPGLLKHKDEYWIGTLAGLRKVKNLPALVRAIAPLPDEWQLVIAGEGPEREAILAEARDQGVEDRVHLPGFVDPARIAALFDLFALSSESEQFPISVVEAMAAGLTIVAPDVGDVREMVSDENRPWIVPAHDEKALADALWRITGDVASTRRIGAANQAKARAEYDEATMIERYRKLYWGAIAKAQASA